MKMTKEQIKYLNILYKHNPAMFEVEVDDRSMPGKLRIKRKGKTIHSVVTQIENEIKMENRAKKIDTVLNGNQSIKTLQKYQELVMQELQKRQRNEQLNELLQ